MAICAPLIVQSLRAPCRLSAAVLAVVGLGSSAVAHAEPATERVSVDAAGVQANAVGEWWYLAPMVALSADGSVVAFSSSATNLVRRDRNRESDVFVRDRVGGTTERVSVTASGREAKGLSFGPALSADARHVAFLSQAHNLPGVARKERGRFVFVRDRVARTTTRVDVSSSGRGGRGGAWAPPLISDDGRYVAFTSDAPNLAPGDDDTTADAFVRDLLGGQTTALSVVPKAQEDYKFSVAAAMSPDGRWIVVMSESPLAPGAVADQPNVFLVDMQTRSTTWVAAADGDIFDASRAAVSADGSVVAFQQRSSNFGVVVWERATGAVTCLSCWNGVPPATWDTLSGMSADGRKIAFMRGGRLSNVFVRDRITGGTDQISVGIGGIMPNGNSGLGGLSADGRYAAFSSDASNLVPGDTNRRTDLFVRGPL